MLNPIKRGVRSARRTSNGWLPASGVEQLEERQMLSATPSPTALTPAEVRSYYGFSNITFTTFGTITVKGHKILVPIAVPGNGTGQTIAILDKYSDPDIVHDLNVFDTQFNLPAINLTVVGGVTATDPTGGWENEESLDVEWAHAIAPGANIVVVNYPAVNEATFLNAVNTAKNYPGVSVVSMSSGGGEFQGELADDSTFTNPTNHNGVNVSFVASSGDDQTGVPVGPIYPSSSPDVLAVGGTVLRLSSSGNTEQSWDDSEGGQSIYEAEPRYQELVQQTGFRTTPDVAYAATNFAAYDSFPLTDTTTNTTTTLDWHTPQGTSLGAPQWAALIAIANQGRALELKPTLSDVPQVFYTLPSRDFNDIVSGPADREGNAPGPGYDEITGLGSPKANLLVQSLLNPPFFIFPPFLISLAAPVGNVTTPSPQAGPDPMVVESGFSSPTHLGALGQSAALPIVPVAAISSEPTVANSVAPSATSVPQMTPAGSGPNGQTAWSPIATESASFGTASVDDTAAGPVSFYFVGPQGDFSLRRTGVGNAAAGDDGSRQPDGLVDATQSAGAAQLTLATDGCFQENEWLVDGTQAQLSTGAARPQKASVAFTATAGILSAWLVRRMRAKRAARNADEAND
jgi:hypothetical protein